LRRAARAGLLLVALLLSDRLLKLYYYGHTYRYYEAGEVYWEDSHTLLLFSPDRHLFWRLKPSITMKLEETPTQYGLFFVGGRPAPYAFTVSTSSRGLNSPEFECRKPPGTFRILALGDSRTMAEGVPFDSVYARRLEAWLEREAGHESRFEVVNAGVSGYSSHQGRVQLERELLACAPDVVTVLFGINDQDRDQAISDRDKARLFDSPLVGAQQILNRSMLVYFARRQASKLRGLILGKTPVRARAYGPPEAGVPRVSVEQYAENLGTMVRLTRERGCRLILLIVPTSPYAYEPSLSRDEPLQADQLQQIEQARALMRAGDVGSALQRLENFRVVYPDSSQAHFLLAQCLQRLGRFQEANREFVAAQQGSVFRPYEAVVRQVARQSGATLLDLSEDFTEPRPEPLYVDDMHPNEAGHHIIAERLARLVQADRRAPGR